MSWPNIAIPEDGNSAPCLHQSETDRHNMAKVDKKVPMITAKAGPRPYSEHRWIAMTMATRSMSPEEKMQEEVQKLFRGARKFCRTWLTNC
mmetsp:Transcript_105527/g.295618  ORF Transcript_105527/g.295618 Transcript_105527/m.295618 type:complete len:91 (+) Transcript_105527:529-801(+)